MKMFSVQVAGESISIQAQIILLLLLKNTLLVRKHALRRQLLILLGLFAGAPIPPCLSMCPFTAALQCRPIPIVPPELPKTPPGSWRGGSSSSRAAEHYSSSRAPPAPQLLTISDHLSALELLRATSVGRYPPSGQQLPQ